MWLGRELFSTPRIIQKNYNHPTLLALKIKANIRRTLLLLCITEISFSDNLGHIYMQVDGAVMGSPLGNLMATYCLFENASFFVVVFCFLLLRSCLDSQIFKSSDIGFKKVHYTYSSEREHSG